MLGRRVPGAGLTVGWRLNAPWFPSRLWPWPVVESEMNEGQKSTSSTQCTLLTYSASP